MWNFFPLKKKKNSTLANSLRISYKHTVYFSHSHFPFLPPTHAGSIQSFPTCVLFNNSWSPVCVACMLSEYEATHWSLVYSLETIPMEKIDSPTSRSPQLSKAPLLGTRTCDLLSAPCCDNGYYNRV